MSPRLFWLLFALLSLAFVSDAFGWWPVVGFAALLALELGLTVWGRWADKRWLQEKARILSSRRFKVTLGVVLLGLGLYYLLVLRWSADGRGADLVCLRS